MKAKSLFSLAAITLLGAAYVTAATDNVAEEVAWVVGDQPIWKSDIEETYQQMLYEKVPIGGDPYCIIPEQLAIEKLYLHQADIDTVEVSDNLVMQQVDEMINYYIANLGSQEKVEQVFHKPLHTLREQQIELAKNRMRVGQVQRSLTEDIKTTPADVRRYYDRLPKDSVPYVPTQVEVQIMTFAPPAPRQEIEDVKARLRDFSDRITRGESDFSTLAILYSEDGSSSRGGEMDFMGRAEFVPEFAAVAFNLNDPKKVSKIVETEYGFHIIQLIEKRGERIKVRHILLRPHISDKDLADAVGRLDSIRADILDHKFTFEEAIPVLSQDKDTHNNRGVMVNEDTRSSRFEMSQLPQEIAKVVDTLEPGEISKAFIMTDPKLHREVVAIVKLTNRIPAHQANMSDDYQLIKNMYETSRQSEILAAWLDKKIKDTYIRIEDGWRNCDFRHKGWIKDSSNSSK